jgi:1,4-dihydroxy-2-naphthoate polyprenyltransferase
MAVQQEVAQRRDARGQAATATAGGVGRHGPKVLVILGHPRSESLCGAVSAALRTSAARAGLEVRQLRLADLEFEPDVTTPDILTQPLEEGLRRAQSLIAWADHLVFVYPNWWGTMPARLKAFLDRVLTPGFAFALDPESGRFVPLLSGRTAEVWVTMDTPRLVHRWLYRAPGDHAMGRATLGFCGVDLVRVTRLGPVHRSDEGTRQRWLRAARRRGVELAGGARTGRQEAQRRLAAWLRVARLQFYPMTWLAYALGALAAAGGVAGVEAAPFWLGLACLTSIKLGTVLANEYIDYASDALNRNFGPFNGGSRMLVDGRLELEEVRWSAASVLGIAALLAGLSVVASPASGFVTAPLLFAIAVLALGYTVPPLRLSYRSLGELDVALTHSIGAILCGFVLQGGVILAPEPLLLALPLFFAVLPSIILAGVPDREADRVVGKRTLAVRFGVPAAYKLAALAVAIAAAAAVVVAQSETLGEMVALVPYAAVPHAALLLFLIGKRLGAGVTAAGRIDGLLVVSLSYMIWFVTLPLFHMLQA